jgi:ParB-like chromosome segregation protein Spo0J
MSNTKTAAEWVKIDTLTPWAENPRHNEHSIKVVAESIKRFGFASPIIARTENREVIAGHTRLLAAQSLGLDTVPVRFMDLDPVDAKLLALADNRIGEIAEWDDDRLSTILSELNDQEINVSGLGFTDEELNSLFGEEIDYSLLDEEDLDNELDDMTQGVRSAIQIDFDADDYDEAKAIVSKLRQDDIYVGGIVLTAIRGINESS